MEGGRQEEHNQFKVDLANFHVRLFWRLLFSRWVKDLKWIVSKDFDTEITFRGSDEYYFRDRDDNFTLDSMETERFQVSSKMKEMTAPSAYPFLVSLLTLAVAYNFIGFLHGDVRFKWVFWFFVFLLITLYCWWKIIYDEFYVANFTEFSTGIVINFRNPLQFFIEYIRATRVAMLLFIASEVMFFFSFFWAFFHSLGSPAIQIGGVWPPYGMEHVLPNPFIIPLTNTLILLTSGVTVTYAHHISSLIFKHSIKDAFEFGFLYDKGITATILLALNFLWWQLFEFVTNDLQLSDGIYGSTFYMLTGFHGFHVIVGTIFLSVFYFSRYEWDDVREVLRQSLLMGFEGTTHSIPTNELRDEEDEVSVKMWNAIEAGMTQKSYPSLLQYLLRTPSVGFDCAIWYWHFVDVVWLFLFVFVYLPDRFLI